MNSHVPPTKGRPTETGMNNARVDPINIRDHINSSMSAKKLNSLSFLSDPPPPSKLNLGNVDIWLTLKDNLDEPLRN